MKKLVSQINKWYKASYFMYALVWVGFLTILFHSKAMYIRNLFKKNLLASPSYPVINKRFDRLISLDINRIIMERNEILLIYHAKTINSWNSWDLISTKIFVQIMIKYMQRVLGTRSLSVLAYPRQRRIMINFNNKPENNNSH